MVALRRRHCHRRPTQRHRARVPSNAWVPAYAVCCSLSAGEPTESVEARAAQRGGLLEGVHRDARPLDWPEEYAERLNPRDDAHRAADRRPGWPVYLGQTVSILYVGAGPMTTLGKKYPGQDAPSVTAVDPLADEYGTRLLDQAGVVPPVRTLAGRGEELLERFAPESFDVAYARNSLDHSDDPARVIANMVRLVRPGGCVALRHYRTEGETEQYHRAAPVELRHPRPEICSSGASGQSTT